MRKFAAFTIIELMITLIISAVVIIIVYYSYFILNTQFAKFRYRTGQMRQYQLLAKAFQRDFERADCIRDTLDGKCVLFRQTDTLISYFLNAEGIVRRLSWPAASQESQGAVMFVDSFAFPGHIDHLTYINDTIHFIREIRIALRVNAEDIILSERKEYSSQQIMAAESVPNER